MQCPSCMRPMSHENGFWRCLCGIRILAGRGWHLKNGGIYNGMPAKTKTLSQPTSHLLQA